MITGIRLTNIRAFEEEHFIPFDRGLTVLMGRNNAGKSTVIRVPFAFHPGARPYQPWWRFQRTNTATCEVTFAVGMPTRELEAATSLPVEAFLALAVNMAGTSNLLAEQPAFRDWVSTPSIELGWRIAGANIYRIVRIRGMTNDSSVITVNQNQSDSVRAILGGVEVTVLNAPHAFAGASFETFESEKGGPFIGPNYLAHWEHDRALRVSDWLTQHTRRVIDTDEKRLQESLTFLRMKHAEQFDRISEALNRAFPEFGRLDFIDEDKQGFNYRPAFVHSGGTEGTLGRENIGSGAWTYLCVITAARAAKVTGARVLMLDEPHLYLHPGLERLLIDELLDPDRWDGEPLQIVAATHSPTFVNAAIARGTLNVLDWVDDTRTKVNVRTIKRDEQPGRIFDAFVSDPGDLLYAERIVFVEGVSDVAALRLLARGRCKLTTQVRYVPLQETDKLGKEAAQYFSIIVQAHGAGMRTKGLLFLDGDKRSTVEEFWKKQEDSGNPYKVPGLSVVWSDPRGNDLESVFCDEAFLVAYFLALNIPEGTSRPQIVAAIGGLKFPAKHKANKGCTAIRTLHEQLLGASDGALTKSDDLENLIDFYLKNADDVVAVEVKKRLAPIEAALTALAT